MGLCDSYDDSDGEAVWDGGGFAAQQGGRKWDAWHDICTAAALIFDDIGQGCSTKTMTGLGPLSSGVLIWAGMVVIYSCVVQEF